MFSQKGKQFDVEKLKANLLMLIEMQALQNRWSENGRDTEWKGRILSHTDGIFKVIAPEQFII
jgi:hypothetical protein